MSEILPYIGITWATCAVLVGIVYHNRLNAETLLAAVVLSPAIALYLFLKGVAGLVRAVAERKL